MTTAFQLDFQLDWPASYTTSIVITAWVQLLTVTLTMILYYVHTVDMECNEESLC